MAPKRKTAPNLSPRRTRSATAGKQAAPPAEAPAPAKTKAKATAKGTPSKKAKLTAPASDAAAKKKKGKGVDSDHHDDDQSKMKKGKEVAEAEETAVAIANGDGDGESKVIIIEACKQCNSFKTRAEQVKDGLEGAVPGITVSINPEKPRRGCFEIREESGQVFVSLLNMSRPFTAMKKLDMDEVVNDIVKRIT